MVSLPKVYMVICEGKSEKAYLSELNRFFREEDIKISFVPKIANSGLYKNVEKIYKKEFKDNKRTPFIIWVDFDLYKRNDHGTMTQYSNKSASIPDFKFSTHNFEDVLSLHLDKNKLQNWVNICNNHNHFITPLHSETYIPLFKNIILDYKKGSFPFEEFNWDLLNIAISNNNDTSIPINCDFLSFLEEALR